MIRESFFAKMFIENSNLDDSSISLVVLLQEFVEKSQIIVALKIIRKVKLLLILLRCVGLVVFQM